MHSIYNCPQRQGRTFLASALDGLLSSGLFTESQELKQFNGIVESESEANRYKV